MAGNPPLTLRTLSRLNGTPRHAAVAAEAALHCTRQLHRAVACAGLGCAELGNDIYWRFDGRSTAAGAPEDR